MSSHEQHSFYQLSPDGILNAIESIGFQCDGRVNALNSYENRVYQIGIEDGPPIIAKFYRPDRWSDACILEEHGFTHDLDMLEIPVVTPLKDDNHQTLFNDGPYRFALYPRVGGRAPELDDPDHLLQLGHCLGRIHRAGMETGFQHRPTIDIQGYATEPSHYLLENHFIPDDLIAAYEGIIKQTISMLEDCFDRAGDYQQVRLHGDCHLGNILWQNDTPCLVDFDDARMGPAIQDIWMLLSGDRSYMTARLHDVLEGYCEFCDFNPRELHLIEALRTMRMIHFSGWLARRWDDPAFPQAFPWFNTQRYWEEHILSLKEQVSMMSEPPLQWQSL